MSDTPHFDRVPGANLLALALITCTLLWSCDVQEDVPDWRKAECMSCTGSDLARCTDGEDNDRDGLTDCDDPDCAAVQTCKLGPVTEENTVALCSNGQDDDEDGYTDCDDFSCQPTLACTPLDKEPENTVLRCIDGLDNDGNGKFDCDDPGCQALTTACEATNAACSDGIDNDNNGFVDCKDFGCSKTSTVTVCQ